MKLFRLIRSGALSAASNMALDEKIFKRYLDDGIGVLRLYRWLAPSFTYGFSQEPQNHIDLAACLRDKVGVAKRITGGGNPSFEPKLADKPLMGRSAMP